MTEPVPGVTPFPAERMAGLAKLSRSYLSREDPIEQSGFGGGAVRWRQEREPILEAVERNGTLLDIGCANGHLLSSLGGWAAERGIALELHGLDISHELVALARARLGDAATLHQGNAWDWEPPRRYTYVYSLHDAVPRDWLPPYIKRLAEVFVEPGGRLIMGSYGSRSRGQAPFDVAAAMREAGFEVAGTARGGDPRLAMFAWIDVT